MLFFECLFDSYKPARLFIIGNSFGWSTVALSLFNPQSQVVAMDAGMDCNSTEGLQGTNKIARKAGLNVEAVQGVSPQDVGTVLAKHFSAPPDFFSSTGCIRTSRLSSISAPSGKKRRRVPYFYFTTCTNSI
jgi:hypothetical protein